MIDVKKELKLLFTLKKTNLNQRKTMTTFLRNLVLFVCAATVGIAAQGEAKSKHKDKEHKDKSSRSEKKSRKHDKKHGKDKEIISEIPSIPVVEPIVEEAAPLPGPQSS